ncbi:MAG: N-acetyltransferase family protein [bacterium]
MAGKTIEIRALNEADWPAVRAIYLEGIATGHATFETEAPPWEAWNTTHFPAPRLVAVSAVRVIGWAALGRISFRTVYAGVAEVSVYVAAAARGLGVGRTLLLKLIADSEVNDIWTLQASIFPENTASLALHKSCGFREVGGRERIGKMKDVWRDTILLERRSHKVGIG